MITKRHRRAWDAASPVVGSIGWVLAPVLPVGTPPRLGSLEHGFLFMPLVAAPFALRLSSILLETAGGRARVGRVARRLQPAAAILLLASFCIAKGAVAGVLTLPWLAMALALAVSAVRRPPPASDGDLSGLNLTAAHVFLPVGAVWLLLSRVGVGPHGFTPLTVFLAALHFHVSGFTLQILVAATGRSLEGTVPVLRVLHRWLSIGVIVAIPLIAAGNALSLPALKFLGVATMVASTLALAVTAVAAARESRPPKARRLLLASAGALAIGMALAGAYGVGELAGASWIEVSTMVKTHGLVNALGFTLCGLLGHLNLQPESRETT